MKHEIIYYNKVLDLEFFTYDLNTKITIRNYLKELLIGLWDRKDGFSGKRPFGDSGWDYAIGDCLAKNNIIESSIEGEDYFVYSMNDVDKLMIDELIPIIFNHRYTNTGEVD